MLRIMERFVAWYIIIRLVAYSVLRRRISLCICLLVAFQVASKALRLAPFPPIAPLIPPAIVLIANPSNR